MSDPADDPRVNRDDPAFALAVQYLKALSFDNVGAPQSFHSGENSGARDSSNEIKIDVQHSPIPDDNEHHEVQILIEVISKADDSVRFTVRANYAAVVMVRNIPEEDLELLLNVETPRMTFPFLRSIISHATHEAGYPALNLSPIDFMVVHRQRQEQLAEKGEGSAKK